MKAQSNIKPDSIQELGDGTSYVNINIVKSEDMFLYDSILIKGGVTRENTTIALLRENYSENDELALNSKSMQLYLNNCTQDQRLRWVKEIQDFTNFRMQCIEKAKEICNK